MHLLRWNNISTQVRGAQHQTCVFYGEGGWKPRKCFPAPVEGEIFSLTFPFIEQALEALIDCLPGTPEEDVGATDDLIVSY